MFVVTSAKGEAVKCGRSFDIFVMCRHLLAPQACCCLCLQRYSTFSKNVRIGP